MTASTKVFSITLLSGLLCGPLFGEELRVIAAYLGPEKPSPFPAQLQVRVTNESFTSASLLESILSSELLVDGEPFKRADLPFKGPAGLAPKSSWEGCMPLENYVAGGLAPGTHHLQLKIGGALSSLIRVKAVRAVPPAETPAERGGQAEALTDLLTPGLLQSCVENWLPEQDGGLQGVHQIRYYVDPGVKVVVSYEDSLPEPRVKGRIRIYAESRVED